MACGTWELACGGWGLANWLVAGGKWLVADGNWLVADGNSLVTDGIWLLADNNWLVADGNWLVMCPELRPDALDAERASCPLCTPIMGFPFHSVIRAQFYLSINVYNDTCKHPTVVPAPNGMKQGKIALSLIYLHT